MIVLCLDTMVISLNHARATRPNIVPSRSLSPTRRRLPGPPTQEQARHCRSDHMPQPRNGTCSRAQPVGELYLDNASRRNFVGLFRIAFGVFLLMLGLLCGSERCRGYGQCLHNQLPTKKVRRDQYPLSPGDLLPWPCSVRSPNATQTWECLPITIMIITTTVKVN